MNGELNRRDLESMSPVYERRSHAILTAGLPCDELCRGMHRARELRRRYFKTIVDRRFASPARRLGRSAGHRFAKWTDGLHRSPFTSLI
jgi:hypothetical protein